MNKTSSRPGPAAGAGRAVPVRIRALGRDADFDAILDIQRRVWAHGETDLTPTHLFRVTARLGAILLGGYVGRKLAGFVYSFPAVFEGRSVQHSHLLAVLPEYRGRGLGKRLKWAQRDRALELGCDLITWTFDPLQARNANLNLHTLGAVTRTYWRNFYGAQEALVLGPGVQTDRFFAEWPIKSARVRKRRSGGPAKAVPPGAGWALARRPENLDSGDARHPLPAVPGARAREQADRLTLPGRPDLTLGGRVVLVEIPPAVIKLREKPELIQAWQRGLRRALEYYLGRGYVVDDFIFGDRCFYVLTLPPGTR